LVLWLIESEKRNRHASSSGRARPCSFTLAARAENGNAYFGVYSGVLKVPGQP
ncbi:MAG: hypothetical protein JWP63_4144, partial [Candidatus Solibacter sp.]|nr:hypothetical protein [Candidatus Solibacter sp.]